MVQSTAAGPASAAGPGFVTSPAGPALLERCISGGGCSGGAEAASAAGAGGSTGAAEAASAGGCTVLALASSDGTGTDAVLVTKTAWQLDFPQSKIS